MRRLGLYLVALSAPVWLASALAEDYEGKRVLHIDSYHEGNEWNDRIAEAVGETLADTGVELKILRMDTKRNPSEAFAKEAALEATKVIETFRPDVVTASDDNASRYLIAPHYKDAALPFVFCGLNWDASTYGFPYSNVTGMVEVSPIPQIVRLLQTHAKGERIGYLAEDTETKHKELDYHQKLFGLAYDQTYFVSTFEAWKEAFLRAQDEVDMLVILGVGALTDFDTEEARAFAEAHTKVPTGTDFEWLMPVSMLGVAKLPEEQGRWAARAAMKILDGVPPSQIPLAYNKEGTLYFNSRIAANLGITEFPAAAELLN